MPESGCTAITHNEACHDADACTIGEFCTATGCQSASTATCSVNWPGIDSICDPDLGCVSEAIACGNGTVQFGEQCDDGNEFADDGCNPECQIEGQSFAPSLWASDVDVDGHGTLAMVGMYTPEGATVQCARPLIGWVSTKTTWAAAPQDLNVSSDEPWVVRAGKSGATMMVWRHYTVPNDYTSIRLDVRYVDATCEVFSPMVRISDTFSNEFYDMDIDDNGNGVVAFNANNRGYLRFFGPDGTPSPANLELPGPNCKFGTHVALSSLGNGGVVSCQGDLDEGVVFWTFDGNGKLTSLATPVPGAAGHTSWYDSHNVYMTGTGGFVIVNADPMTGETRAASFNHLGELVKAETVFFNQAPPSFCYDTYRFGRIKNLEKEGFAIVSMVASGECFAKDHTALAYIQPETGFFSMAVQRPLPLQRTTLDRVGNTYVLDSTGKILINHFYL